VKSWSKPGRADPLNPRFLLRRSRLSERLLGAPALCIADLLAAERAALKLFKVVARFGNIGVGGALQAFELVNLRSELSAAVDQLVQPGRFRAAGVREGEQPWVDHGVSIAAGRDEIARCVAHQENTSTDAAIINSNAPGEPIGRRAPAVPPFSRQTAAPF
jgi:hypothetical protein